MDIILQKELCDMIRFTSLQDEGVNPEMVQTQGYTAAFRSALLKYMLYLISDKGSVSDGEADFINATIGTMMSRERLTSIMRIQPFDDEREMNRIPRIFQLLVSTDNAEDIGEEEIGKLGRIREKLYSSWGMLRIFAMVGNRLCSYGSGEPDTPEKLEKRRAYLMHIGKYIEASIIHKEYDASAEYKPPVPEFPLHGSAEELFVLYGIYENDNPYMPSVDAKWNPIEEKTEEEDEKEIMEALFQDVLSQGRTPAELQAFSYMLRRGVKIDPAWKTPSEIAAEHPGEEMPRRKFEVEKMLLNIPSLESNSVEDLWHEFDYGDEDYDFPFPSEVDGVHFIKADTPEGISKAIAGAFGLEMSEEEEEREKEYALSNESKKYEGMTLAQLKKELESLIGLQKAKKDINSTINIMRVNEERKKNGIKPSVMTKHMVFMGNPGTGKTTVARLIAAIYKKMGVLSKGQLVETDSGGLIAEYVGQTAVKTKAVVEKAMGGVLFIDEAYMLTSSHSSFGEEAIATLLKLMEDRRDDLVVIFAGYTDLMNEFLNKNPGVRSRINKYIEFENYNGDELVGIFKLMCKEAEYYPDKKCMEYTDKYFHDKAAKKLKNFANGRAVRNYLEKAICNQADRLALENRFSKNALRKLQLEDVQGINMDAQDGAKKNPIGFGTA